MIDEDRTVQVYGYYSNELSPESHKRVVVVCEECGRYHTPEKRRVKVLCKSCVKTGENSPSWRGGKITLTCKQCGKEFDIKPSRKDTAKFCSRRCDSEWRSENMSGENSLLYGKHCPERAGKNNTNWKPKITLKCLQCKKEFDVTPARKDIADFCSVKCKGEWRSENLVGENAPHWNPNLTIEERIRRRNYPEYKQWVQVVYKRDNYTCQVCGDSIGGNLNAHHIESYNNNPELRTELSNGITMCECCHNNFHHIYGFGNNARDQYNEFVMIMYNKKEL